MDIQEQSQAQILEKQLSEWKDFQAQQAAVHALEEKPLYKALQTVKSVAEMPGGMLTKLKLNIHDNLMTLPVRAFFAIPKDIRDSFSGISSRFLKGFEDFHQRRLDKAIAEVAAVPEGKLLVDQVQKDGVPVFLQRKTSAGGALYSHFSVDKETNALKVERSIGINMFQSHGSMVRVVAHEFEHYNQAKNGVMAPYQGQSLKAPLDHVWFNRMIEADAEATSVDIAYKLKEAGKPAAWKSALKSNLGYNKVAEAYAKMARKDPSSVLDGRAKRAAFDGWFKTKNTAENLSISKLYNAQGMSAFPSDADLKLATDKPGAKLSPLTPQELKKLGTLLPAANNYLDLPGQKPLNSTFYREPNFRKGDMQWIDHNYEVYAAAAKKSSFMNAGATGGTAGAKPGTGGTTTASMAGKPVLKIEPLLRRAGITQLSLQRPAVAPHKPAVAMPKVK